MTSLRGLDGLKSKQNENGKEIKPSSGLSIRDLSILDNFSKQLSRGLIDINDREVARNKQGIFNFTYDDSQRKDVIRLRKPHHADDQDANYQRPEGSSSVSSQNRSQSSESQPK